jgi:multidrug resistance efflux pump
MVVAAACGGGDGEGVDPALIRVVERGDLVITVRERGEIRAARDTRVSSSLEGRATLIHLVPEGTVVQAGDRVAELDVSAIVEKRAQQAIAVAKAAAALEQAQKTVEIVEKELQAAWRTAETRVQIARLRKEKFLGHERKAAAGATGARNGTPGVAGADGTEDAEGTSAADAPNGSGGARGAPPTADTAAGTNAEVFARLGEMANQILRSINAIALARADLENAAQTLHYSQKLAERGFITANELQRDQLQHQRQLSAQTLGWNDLLLLVDYTLPETLIGLALEIENAELALESVRATNDARRVREAAELRSIEAEHGLAKEQLENWDRQIENGVLKAPAPGLVVYARMTGTSRCTRAWRCASGRRSSCSPTSPACSSSSACPRRRSGASRPDSPRRCRSTRSRAGASRGA